MLDLETNMPILRPIGDRNTCLKPLLSALREPLNIYYSWDLLLGFIIVHIECIQGTFLMVKINDDSA